MKRYDSYKDSGVEWIGEIPSHWEMKRLKYVCNIEYGSSLPTNERIEGDIPVYGSNGIVGYHDIAITDSPCIIVGRKGSYGKINISNVKCFPIDTTYYIDNSQTKEDIDWLFYMLGTLNLDGFSEDTGVPGLSREYAYFKKVIVPSIDEQTAIASFLDRKTTAIDQLITDKKRLIELYEEEKTAIINQAVTKGIDPDVKLKDSGIEWLGEIPGHWEVKRIRYFFNLITEKKENTLKKIGLENIESKTGKFIESDSDFEGQGICFIKDDILFGKLRPYLAKIWLADFEGQAVGDFYIFRSKEHVISQYAKYRLLDSSFIEITNSSTYGSKMPRVSWDFIANLSIAFPPIKEQYSIVLYIETACSHINAKISKTKKLIALLLEYRTTLISEVVTGKIKVV